MTRTSPASRNLATAAAVGSILLWFWSGVCFVQGARRVGTLAYLTLITGGGALTVLALQALRRRPLRDLLRLPPRVAVAGFWGVAFYTIILALAFGLAEERDIGQVNLLNYLWPIWIVVLGIFLLDERPRVGLTMAGALLGFAGVGLARGLETFTRIPSSLLPQGLALLGGFLWALYCVLLRRWRIPAERGGTAFHFTVCAILSAALAGWRGEWRAWPGLTAPALFWILFGAIGPVGLAYHWWEIGVKRGNIHVISLLAYFIPIGSSILIALFFKGAMSPGLIPGAIMIAAGAWLVSRAAPTGRPGRT
ncbi:MAG: EamA family transporter [bacterium]|nr:EamA family transporter [bacterium]